MKYNVVNLPINAIAGDYEAPAVTTLKMQRDGTLLCGLSFASPALLRLNVSAQGNLDKVENLAEKAGFDSNTLAVVNGLRAAQSGESIFCLLHEGFTPGFLKGILGKKIEGKKGEALMGFLNSQGGSSVRHSVVEIRNDGEIIGRRVKEPGILWDTLQMGSYVFGLEGGALWREPYLNSEKREVLRSDLHGNFCFHRDDAGYFWFMRDTGQLLRLGLSDIKPVPTPLKSLSKEGLFCSSASSVDGWIYLSSKNILFRVRKNSISGEEELQEVATLSGAITSLLCLDDSRVKKLFVAIEGTECAEIWSLDLVAPEDPEMMPKVPELKKHIQIAELKIVNSLTSLFEAANIEDSDEDSGKDSPAENSPQGDSKLSHKIVSQKAAGPVVMWGGEGKLGWGQEKNSVQQPLRLLRIEL